MGKAIKKKPTKKPSETDVTDKALSFFIDRFDSLEQASKEILRSLGKCLGDWVRDGVSKAYKPLAIEWEGKAHINVKAYKIHKIAEAKAKAALIQTETKVPQNLSQAYGS